MAIPDKVYVFMNDTASFVKSQRSGKLKIARAQARLNALSVFKRRKKLCSASVLGFNIHAFSFSSIKGLFRDIFYKGEYDFQTVKKNPLIIDCGANIGMATLYFKWKFPQARVYSFEADPETYNILKKNITANKLKNVEAFNNAVWDKNEKISFFSDPSNQGSLMMSTNSKRISGKKTSITARSLSDFIKGKEVDLLKMDIEGAEMRVIADLDKKNTLKNIREMIIEYHHKVGNDKSELGKFLGILERNGFEYQLDAKCIPLSSKDKYQDVMIYAYLK